ncbi:apolipoprotein O domain protein [Metarhizium robertsii]|uniref:MICOS complex subunit n=2 Tax=Metarhizium robertsii TaxID=568076 RepID=E9F0D1_METRA|nr:Apolipoprotein O [Metarhizium robertsii ARSEF 23]EFY98591.1 Apolipoprotein O [Metarhizium robertsii ARSEF 23]EXV04264.1 apolipoprotein O domain protein [Metarhizium robertsii]
MAARVLMQRRSLAPLATIALGGLAFAPATVLAEGPVDKKKPIYDDLDAPSANDAPAPAAPIKALQFSQPPAQEEPKKEKKPRGPSPTDRLAVQIGKARMALYRFAVCTENKVNETMDSAFNLEQSFTNTIASLAPSRESGEKLMPGTIYVLVAAMAGSILTRNRNILLRSTVPLAFGVGAGWTVLPVTMRNISDLSWKYEQRFPAVAETHVNIREGLKRGISFAKVHSQVGVQYVDDKVTDAREAVEGWVKQGK